MFAHCLVQAVLQPFLCHQNTNTPPPAHYSEGKKKNKASKKNQSNLMASHVLDLCRSSLISGVTFSLCFEIWFILPYTAVGMRAQPQQPWGSGRRHSLPAGTGWRTWCREWGK